MGRKMKFSTISLALLGFAASYVSAAYGRARQCPYTSSAIEGGSGCDVMREFSTLSWALCGRNCSQNRQCAVWTFRSGTCRLHYKSSFGRCSIHSVGDASYYAGENDCPDLSALRKVDNERAQRVRDPKCRTRACNAQRKLDLYNSMRG